MCGIVGIASTRGDIAREWVSKGCDAIRHRGPDSSGEWWSADGRVGLAHRRLAIVDLSSAGHQPMVGEDEAAVVVFNGEIYNFVQVREELAAKGVVFRSRTDTEVLLAAYRTWGIDCLTRLNGMFAFAIYDSRRNQLFLARDRAGEKPLFYRLAKGEIRFASELKALLADRSLSRAVDRESLDCFLSMGYVPGERSILNGFNKLPPAHALRFDLDSGESKVWRYWHLPEQRHEQLDEAELLDELEVLLKDAVGRQLVADVPVGVLLSGGIDSSLITALAAEVSSRTVKTFNIRFPGYGKLDEGPHAQRIARHFATEHIELEADPSTADLLPALVRQFDEPIADSSMIPTYMVSLLVRRHCTVALGGDGGDELFGGYGTYRSLLRMRSGPGRVPRWLRAPLAFIAERAMAPGVRGRNWLQGLGADLRDSLPSNTPFFDATTRRRLFRGYPGWPIVSERVFRERVIRHADLIQRATRTDFENYLAEDILPKVDRTSMAHSLEIRAPFLDQRVIEFAYGKVPSTLKANAGEKKILLNRLTERLLPADFDRKREQGFSIRLDEWLKEGPWLELFTSVLTDPGAPYDQRVVQSLLRGNQLGCSNSGRLFALAVLEIWRREYDVAFG